MANLEFNTNNIKRVPISRNNFLYSEELFDFHVQLGKEYVEQFMNQTAVLYSVDLSATNIDSIYGETNSNEVRFKTPVEFHCVYKIDGPELRSYDKTKNIGTYMKTGKLEIGVYQKTLDELGIDIKDGDYIGIQIDESRMIFFYVVNNGLNNTDNESTMYGVKPYFRKITCGPVDQSEFKI